MVMEGDLIGFVMITELKWRICILDSEGWRHEGGNRFKGILGEVMKWVGVWSVSILA